MRVGVHPGSGIGELDAFQGLLGRGSGFAGAHVAMQPQRLGHLVADVHDRIQGGHRLLKNHRQPVTADLAQLALGHCQQVPPLVNDLS